MPPTFRGLDCIIRNLSNAGACLLIDSGKMPVDEFELIIFPEYLKRRCKVVWRQQDKLGVQFLPSAILAPATSSPAEALQLL